MVIEKWGISKAEVKTCIEMRNIQAKEEIKGNGTKTASNMGILTFNMYEAMYQCVKRL